MTAKLLTGMSSLAETENKNNNIQTTKHKQNKTKNKSKPQKNSKTKKNGKSFTTMISRPDTTLTDFTSNLKGYLSHKCNVPLQKLKA